MKMRLEKQMKISRELQDERNRLDENAPQVMVDLPLHHLLEQQGVVDHEAADQRQPERDFVAYSFPWREGITS